MTLLEAAKQACEVLQRELDPDNFVPVAEIAKAESDLRAAIKQAENTEPFAVTTGYYGGHPTIAPLDKSVVVQSNMPLYTASQMIPAAPQPEGK